MLPIDTGVAVAARDALRHIHCTDGCSVIYEETVLRIVFQCGYLRTLLDELVIDILVIVNKIAMNRISVVSIKPPIFVSYNTSNN